MLQVDAEIGRLGFPKAQTVQSLYSIAHLFPPTTSRTGIYLLLFAGGAAYIGQAVDVVRRFGAHRKCYEDLAAFSFVPVPREKLNSAERDFIRKAEALGFVLRNTIHVANIVGDVDLDDVISPAEQSTWLAEPRRISLWEEAQGVSPSEQLVERGSLRFSTFCRHPLHAQALESLGTYLRNCVPFPRRTELSFWSLSCMPGTNGDSWPRLLCLNAGVMELFVLGWARGDRRRMWSLVNVATDVSPGDPDWIEKIRLRVPGTEMFRRDYRDAGQYQMSLQTSDAASTRLLLGDPEVQYAARVLALRVMRKRATIYSRYHCKQLSDAATAQAQS